ncbi:zinc finger protein 691-like [Pygocentrus nattereri]|uniref:zinc finger protein 691-like n=1 Tax=Pygocentrus nattereri TaxID=42514 RepID=UPI0008145E0C|nr:zinc finger protein 691-like [Pygocentrus nattereri]
MARMEHLNSFFIERLMSVAGEIFEAVKDTVSEYQEEIERTKQENRRLREILTEISLSASSEIRAADVRHSRAGGAPLEQDSNQRPLNSDPSVLQLKLELATIKQEAEPQLPLNDAPTSTSPCAQSAHDTWTSHADGVLLEQQNSSQGPQDPEPALIQVKLELATLQDEHGPPQLLTKEKHGGDQEPDRCVSFNALGMEGRKDDCLRRDSFIAIKLEPCNSQVPQLSSAQIQSGHHLDSMESETGICPRPHCNQICDDLSSVAAHSQSHLPEKAFTCSVCDKPLSRAWLLKKHMITCHKERPYRCDLCGKSYGDAHVLRVHLKTHSTERPFRCNSCGKMYKKKSHLKDHERTHTGDKRYSCSACGMCFIWTNQVKVHIQNHHRGQLATVIKKSIA